VIRWAKYYQNFSNHDSAIIAAPHYAENVCQVVALELIKLMARTFSETARSKPRADKKFTRFRLEDEHTCRMIELNVDNLMY
jgi:hypothetical protein